jgi:hypothetical protein
MKTITVEHVTCEDRTEYWICGDVVLEECSIGFTLSVGGAHQIYLTRGALEKLALIFWERDNRTDTQ